PGGGPRRRAARGRRGSKRGPVLSGRRICAATTNDAGTGARGSCGHPRGLTPEPSRAARSPSAEAVGAGEPLREQAHEDRGGKADDVEVVAVDPAHEGGAAALDGVSAGAALPLAARDVRGQVP